MSEHLTSDNPSQTPDEYLRTPVPLEIRRGWRTWTGVEWRLNQHYQRGSFRPPDQRHGVEIPVELCAHHRRQWIAWRNTRLRAARWPGGGAGGWASALTEDGLHEAWDSARAEWDEKTIEQMKLVETDCATARNCDRRAAVVLHDRADNLRGVA